jgi:hypothetical protein
MRRRDPDATEAALYRCRDILGGEAALCALTDKSRWVVRGWLGGRIPLPFDMARIIDAEIYRTAGVRPLHDLFVSTSPESAELCVITETMQAAEHVGGIAGLIQKLTRRRDVRDLDEVEDRAGRLRMVVGRILEACRQVRRRRDNQPLNVMVTE